MGHDAVAAVLVPVGRSVYSADTISFVHFSLSLKVHSCLWLFDIFRISYGFPLRTRQYPLANAMHRDRDSSRHTATAAFVGVWESIENTDGRRDILDLREKVKALGSYAVHVSHSLRSML